MSCRSAAAPSDGLCTSAAVTAFPGANSQPSLPAGWLIPGKAGHLLGPCRTSGVSQLPGRRVLLLPLAIPSWICPGWSSRAGKVTTNQEGAPSKWALKSTREGKGELCCRSPGDQRLGPDTRRSLKCKQVL